MKICTHHEVSDETIFILASCHSLSQLDDEIIGDPMEKAILETIEWSIQSNELYCFVYILLL
jgi:cation-transporting ATPase 13A1